MKSSEEFFCDKEFPKQFILRFTSDVDSVNKKAL